MKRKGSTSSIDLNEIGVQFYREKNLSDALSHFQMALNTTTYSMQENNHSLAMNKKIKLSTDSISSDTEYDDIKCSEYYETDKFQRCTIRSHYDEGITNFLHVLSLQEKCWDESATILFNLGVVNHMMNKHESALYFYLKSISSVNCLKNGFLITANLCNIGNIYYIKKEFRKSLQSYSDALELGKHDQATKSSILNCIGLLNAKIDGKYDEVSIQILRESLQIKICSEGSLHHSDVSIIFNNMGKIFLRNGKSISAKKVFNKALSIRKQLYGDDSLKVAEIVKNLALLYNLEGDSEKEATMYYKFLRIARSNFIWIDLEVAKTLNYLGQLHQRYKRFDKAIEAFEESIQIYDVILGQYNPVTATLLNKIGCLYYEMSNNEMAINYFRRELLIELKLYKNYNLKVIVTLTNLAEIFKEQDDYDHSLVLYKHIASIQEAILGRDHIDMSITLSNIGYILYQKEFFSESVTMYQRALKIRTASLPSDSDTESASILTQLGLAYIQLNKWFVALDVLSKSIEIRKLRNKSNIGRDDEEETAVTFSNIGMIHEQFGDEQKALINYEQALEIKIRILGHEHEEVARMLFRMGRIHMSMGAVDNHLEHALKILTMALHIQRKKVLNNSESEISIARTLNCIGNVHLQRGDIDKSMQILIEASRIYREAGISDLAIVAEPAIGDLAIVAEPAAAAA